MSLFPFPARARRLTSGMAATALALALAACTSIGPPSVPRDRNDYLNALSTSWKVQTLSNVVHIRYGDAPSFLDVSSIVSAYTLETNATAGLTINSLSVPASTVLPYSASTLGLGVTYGDRPTISYTPLGGEKLTKRLIRPIPPAGIFELIQAGQAADLVLQLTVRSLNGIKNESISGGVLEPADPEFYPLLDAFRRLQIAGLLSVRTEKRGGEEVGVISIVEGRTPKASEDAKFVRDTLRVKPGRNGDLTIVFAPRPNGDSELAVLSRSMGDILIDLAMSIDVPPEHIKEGRTIPTVRLAAAANPRERPFVTIKSGPTPPSNAFVATSYGNSWYWIDDNDYASKRTFTLLLIFTSLAETGVVTQIPALTLPVR